MIVVTIMYAEKLTALSLSRESPHVSVTFLYLSFRSDTLLTLRTVRMYVFGKLLAGAFVFVFIRSFVALRCLFSSFFFRFRFLIKLIIRFLIFYNILSYGF